MISLSKKSTSRYRIAIGFLPKLFSRHWLANKRKKFLERSSPLKSVLLSVGCFNLPSFTLGIRSALWVLHPIVRRPRLSVTGRRPPLLSRLDSFSVSCRIYRRFIQIFSEIAKPFRALTHKHASFVWSPETQASVDKLKSCLLSAPVLGYPDPPHEFILDTDASDVAIAAVFSQLDDQGRETVIAYGSATLSKSQRDYTATNRECYAVVHFCESFRHYLVGSKFTLRTDHAALVCLASFKSPDSMLACWIERLSIFTYDINHRPGKRHINADALSRLPEACVCSVTTQPPDTPTAEPSMPSRQPTQTSPLLPNGL